MKCLRLMVVLALGGGCGGELGVCTGSNGRSTYCKDGWSRSECADWNSMQVNGVSWNFFAGQTCAGRGTPATP